MKAQRNHEEGKRGRENIGDNRKQSQGRLKFNYINKYIKCKCLKHQLKDTDCQIT